VCLSAESAYSLVQNPRRKLPGVWLKECKHLVTQVRDHVVLHRVRFRDVADSARGMLHHSCAISLAYRQWAQLRYNSANMSSVRGYVQGCIKTAPCLCTHSSTRDVCTASVGDIISPEIFILLTVSLCTCHAPLWHALKNVSGWLGRHSVCSLGGTAPLWVILGFEFWFKFCIQLRSFRYICLPCGSSNVSHANVAVGFGNCTAKCSCF
jgi:hypothetical protein